MQQLESAPACLAAPVSSCCRARASGEPLRPAAGAGCCATVVDKGTLPSFIWAVIQSHPNVLINCFPSVIGSAALQACWGLSSAVPQHHPGAGLAPAAPRLFCDDAAGACMPLHLFSYCCTGWRVEQLVGTCWGAASSLPGCRRRLCGVQRHRQDGRQQPPTSPSPCSMCAGTSRCAGAWHSCCLQAACKQRRLPLNATVSHPPLQHPFPSSQTPFIVLASWIAALYLTVYFTWGFIWWLVVR